MGREKTWCFLATVSDLAWLVFSGGMGHYLWIRKESESDNQESFVGKASGEDHVDLKRSSPGDG